MPGSSLPTDNALDKSVQEFGIGTYDFPQSQFEHGEDSEDLPSEKSPHGKALPDGGGPLDPFGPDRLLSYPATYSSGDLPGDYDLPPKGHKRSDETLDSVVHSESQSKLPNDEDNPASRSDYYDNMVTGAIGDAESIENIWADEDSGAWASDEVKSLPNVNKNDVNSDDNLGALGNYWSGNILEDVTGSYGFPSTELLENADFPRSDQDDGGYVRASGGVGMNRQATNINLVMKLAQEFLKEHGKKGLTRRHVLSFLQKAKQHQYLASDMIRCLKLAHSIYIKDVLDEFPIAKTASVHISSLDILSENIVDLSVLYRNNPEIFKELQACVADISYASGLYDRLNKKASNLPNEVISADVVSVDGNIASIILENGKTIKVALPDSSASKEEILNVIARSIYSASEDH